MINNSQRDSPPRIMVVDDEKDILRVIKRDLESGRNNNNYETYFLVDAFSSSELALDAIEHHPANYYDLVLTDIRMPKMNGFELYKEEFSKVLPSIDVKDFIIKPISMANLIRKLKSMIDTTAEGK